jgi:hypothetical protein
LFQTLTSQIGKIVELEDVDKGLDDYRSTTYLTFEQFRYYLFKEVSLFLYHYLGWGDSYYWVLILFRVRIHNTSFSS